MELMRAAGLEASIDDAGNVLGRRNGTDANLPPLMFDPISTPFLTAATMMGKSAPWAPSKSLTRWTTAA